MTQLFLAVLVFWSAGAEARSRSVPLEDPVLLNMGFVCRWQSRCIKMQQRAMRSTLKYVKKYRPPPWKVQVCNRNSSRNGTRKDWVGFDNCIRNPAVRRPAVQRQNGRR